MDQHDSTGIPGVAIRYPVVPTHQAAQDATVQCLQMAVRLQEQEMAARRPQPKPQPQ